MSAGINQQCHTHNVQTLNWWKMVSQQDPKMKFKSSVSGTSYKKVDGQNKAEH